MATVAQHLRRRNSSSASVIWQNLAEDLFALFDEAADGLRRLECGDVPEEMRMRVPKLSSDMLCRLLKVLEVEQ